MFGLVQRAKERAEEGEASSEPRNDAQKQAPGGRPPRHSDAADGAEHEARGDEQEPTGEERDQSVADQRPSHNDPDEPSGHLPESEGARWPPATATVGDVRQS